MNDGKLPPPFVVGQKYLDREGEYTVTATDTDHVSIERPDGRRKIQNAAAKARIHRNIVMDRDADVGGDRSHRTKKRLEPSKRRKGLMERILQLEADGASHAGVEIDRLLLGSARDLGYSVNDVSTLHQKTGRSVFANDGDWAKAELTAGQLHEVIGTMVHWEGGARRECNVYRITPRGLEELHKQRPTPRR